MIASGILIDDGVIITNRHVVENYQSVLVRDFGGEIEDLLPADYKPKIKITVSQSDH